MPASQGRIIRYRIGEDRQRVGRAQHRFERGIAASVPSLPQSSFVPYLALFSSRWSERRSGPDPWKLLSLPDRALEVLVHARWHGLVVLISNVCAYCLRVQKAVTANAAMPLVARKHIWTPVGASRIGFGIGHFNSSSTQAHRRAA